MCGLNNGTNHYAHYIVSKLPWLWLADEYSRQQMWTTGEWIEKRILAIETINQVP